MSKTYITFNIQVDQNNLVKLENIDHELKKFVIKNK